MAYDMAGQTFGQWTAIESRGSGFWLSECSCGAVRVVSGYKLRTGGSISCGHRDFDPVECDCPPEPDEDGWCCDPDPIGECRCCKRRVMPDRLSA